MSNITINIEFLAGTRIENAVREAAMLAKRMEIAYASFDFNGVKCSVSRRALALTDEKILEQWNESLNQTKLLII
jgi:hypothetical protein